MKFLMAQRFMAEWLARRSANLEDHRLKVSTATDTTFFLRSQSKRKLPPLSKTVAQTVRNIKFERTKRKIYLYGRRGLDKKLNEIFWRVFHSFQRVFLVPALLEWTASVLVPCPRMPSYTCSEFR